MIPLNFYRDDEYVYYNNPNGITKKMTIAEFEAVMSGEGGGDIPEHSSSNQGEVLSVDANGDLVWKTLPPSGELTTQLLSVQYSGETISITAGGSASLINFTFLDGETYDTVNIAETDFDLCTLISLQLPGGLVISGVALPDNTAYTSLTINVENISDHSIQLAQNYDIAYLKLLNPRIIESNGD